MRAISLLSLTAVFLFACRGGNQTDRVQHDDEAEARATTDVPIERVVLYRSGIAYVERSGEVDDSALRLQIEPDQINDILTTLTIIVDNGENLASSVGLPIERTVAHDLNTLPPQVRQQGGMVALLEAFRGAEVRLEAQGGSVEGRVIGTETLTNDEGNLIRHVTLMNNDGELRQFRVDQVRRVSLRNQTLEAGLERSLDVSLGEGDWKPIELTIHLSGDPPHDVFMSYVVEMPTWKPTYRILVDDENLHLQGWAVVDNISGEDWQDISLSLVAGTPISFQYDLHSPRFIARPDLTARGFAALALVAPEVESGVRNRDEEGERERGDRRRRRSEPQPAGAAAAPMDATATATAEEELGRYLSDMDGEGLDDYRSGAVGFEPAALVDSMSESAAAEQLDNLFRYDIGHEVSVPDRGSALVSVVNEPMDGEDVLYFDPQSPSPQARNQPYRAVRLVNSTGFTIERGPLSIYKDGTFVGQAIGPRIGEEEMVFLPYSMDGRFHIEERQSNAEEGVRLVRIVNSIIYSEIQNIRRRTYQIVNNSGEAARLYVRVPKQTNWVLRQPDPEESGVVDQGAVWFVPLELDGSASQELTIDEASTVTRSVEIWSAIAADTIALYISSTEAVPEIAEALQTVLDQRARTAAIEVELQTLRNRRNDVYRRMAEIRANLEALGDSRQSRELRRTLEQRLSEQEDEATHLTVSVVELEEEEAELRAMISTALMDLELQDPMAQ